MGRLLTAAGGKQLLCLVARMSAGQSWTVWLEGQLPDRAGLSGWRYGCRTELDCLDGGNTGGRAGGAAAGVGLAGVSADGRQCRRLADCGLVSHEPLERLLCRRCSRLAAAASVTGAAGCHWGGGPVPHRSPPLHRTVRAVRTHRGKNGAGVFVLRAVSTSPSPAIRPPPPPPRLSTASQCRPTGSYIC